MNIKFHGHACFSIEEGKFRIVTDPFTDNLPKLKADVVTISHDHEAYNNAKGVEGEPKIFNWPGEYETGGVHFQGVHSFHNTKDDEEQLENTVFTVYMNDIHLCHLGAQGAKLTPEQLEKIGDVDVLFIPVGGHSVIDAKKAKEVVEQIEPRVIIPMVYQTDGNKMELDPLDSFLSAMGKKDVEPMDEFKVKRSDLPEDNSKVVVLNPTT